MTEKQDLDKLGAESFVGQLRDEVRALQKRVSEIEKLLKNRDLID